MGHETEITVEVEVENTTVDARVRDGRADTLAAFGPLTTGQRAGLVTDAWTVGLRALMNAYKQAEESRLQDIGKTLSEDLDKQLAAYLARQQATLAQVLAHYFDPRDGQVVARLEAFLRDDGELAQTMSTYLAPENGALAQTLARELGENSPLLRRLSPTESDGIVCLLEARLCDALRSNQAELAKALDPVAADGAVARFLRALRQELEKADHNRAQQLSLATKALDANDENSLLSRLMKETAGARVAFVSAMNPNIPTSPLAVLKDALAEQLRQYAKSQQDTLHEMSERQARLERDIRDSLVRLEARKQADMKSTRGGVEFEKAVLAFIQHAVQGAPIEVDATGNSYGAKPQCRVGDQVLRFTPESIYAGGALVVEAKRDNSYTVSSALKELELARGNRLAHVGLFVMARTHAPAGFPRFARYANDIIVVWDCDDENSDPYLHAAVLLGLALASRQRKPEDAGEIKALADVEHRIQRELERLERMRKLSDSIKSDADKLGEETRKGGDALGALLKKAKSTLTALNVELEVAESRGSEAVGLPAASLTQARAAVIAHAGERSVDSSEAA